MFHFTQTCCKHNGQRGPGNSLHLLNRGQACKPAVTSFSTTSRRLETSAVFYNIFRDRLSYSARDHIKPPLRAFSWAKTTLGRLSLAKLWPSPVSWPGKVHSCSPVVPKLTGPWLFWLRQPPLLSPAVPDGEQEIRQGGQKFSPQLPGSAQLRKLRGGCRALPPPLQQTIPSPPGFSSLPAAPRRRGNPDFS